MAHVVGRRRGRADAALHVPVVGAGGVVVGVTAGGVHGQGGE